MKQHAGGKGEANKFSANHALKKRSAKVPSSVKIFRGGQALEKPEIVSGKHKVKIVKGNKGNAMQVE